MKEFIINHGDLTKWICIGIGFIAIIYAIIQQRKADRIHKEIKERINKLKQP